MARMADSNEACYCAHNNDKVADSQFKYYAIKLHFHPFRGTDRMSKLKI